MRSILFFIPFVLFADGGVIPPEEHIESYAQVAFIKYEEGREELYIVNKHAEYRGTLAWVVPFSSKPTVDTFNLQLFDELYELSKPLRESYGYGCGPFLKDYNSESLKEDIGKTDIKIIETGELPGLEYIIIYAEREDTLKSWLLKNGFNVGNEVSSIFRFYIEKEWKFFFVAKRKSDYSNVLGVKFRFETDTPLYPMKLTSINFDTGDYELYLYIAAKHKMLVEDAELKYANNIDEREMEEIKKNYPYLADNLEHPLFITKIYKKYNSKQEMEDIQLLLAPDDSEYREIEDYGSIDIFFLLGVAFIAGVYVKKRTE